MTLNDYYGKNIRGNDIEEGAYPVESIIIGEVLKPQGIQGEMKVYPLTDDPSRYKKLKQVQLCNEKNADTFLVNNVRIDPKGLVFLTLEGITDREKADQYRGYTVRIGRAQVPKLDQRWYYFELEGMKVYENDILLGTLTKVIATGANDVYMVEGKDQEILIPALKTVIMNVDVTEKRMDVILPPGLLDK